MRRDFTRTLGGSYPSVQATLTHMVWAEWLWLERWQDRSPKQLFASEEFPSVADVRARWSPDPGRAGDVRRVADGEQLLRTGRYTNRQGEVWEYALWRQFHHLFNHSTYIAAR